MEQKLALFIDAWEDTPEKVKEVFVHLKEYLEKKEGVTLNFVSRPGVTYSLRAVHANQRKKKLFVLVDVIDETPPWLSVCFYGETISDPEERGDALPRGLLGEDAVCFDFEERDDEYLTYIEARLDEAHQSAAKG